MDEHQEQYLRFVTYVHINGLIGRLDYSLDNINDCVEEKIRKMYVENAYLKCLTLENFKNNIENSNCSYLVDIQSESVKKTIDNIPKCMTRRPFCNPITRNMKSAVEDVVYDLNDNQKKILRDAIIEHGIDSVKIGLILQQNDIELGCDIEFTEKYFNMLYDELKNVCVNYMNQ